MTQGADKTASKTILFLVSSMHGGGAERVAAMLCNYWAEQGHKVMLMPTFSKRGTCVYDLHAAVELNYLADRVADRAVLSRLGAAGRFLALRRAISDIAPDCVVSFLTHNNVAAILASGGSGIPVYVCERSYPPRMPLPMMWRLLRRLFYRRAARVVMQTSDGLEWLRRNCRGAHGIVIPNPIVLPLTESPPRLLPENHVTEGERLIVALGRLSEEKGFATLIEAFAAATRENRGWRLAILGDGPLRPQLEALCAQLGVESSVVLPGWAGNAADWYGRADAFVLSSRFEGFPNALLEAMAHGVAAVSVNCRTGPSDLIEDGHNGLLVDEAAGAGGLAEALSRIMQDSDLRQRLADNARLSGDRYSLQRIGALWDQMIDGEYD